MVVDACRLVAPERDGANRLEVQGRAGLRKPLVAAGALEDAQLPDETVGGDPSLEEDASSPALLAQALGVERPCPFELFRRRHKVLLRRRHGRADRILVEARESALVEDDDQMIGGVGRKDIAFGEKARREEGDGRLMALPLRRHEAQGDVSRPTRRREKNLRHREGRAPRTATRRGKQVRDEARRIPGHGSHDGGSGTSGESNRGRGARGRLRFLFGVARHRLPEDGGEDARVERVAVRGKPLGAIGTKRGDPADQLARHLGRTFPGDGVLERRARARLTGSVQNPRRRGPRPRLRVVQGLMKLRFDGVFAGAADEKSDAARRESWRGRLALGPKTHGRERERERERQADRGAAHHDYREEMSAAEAASGAFAIRIWCARETAAVIAKSSAPMSTVRKRSACRFSSFAPCVTMRWRIVRASFRAVRSRKRTCAAREPYSEKRGQRPQPSHRDGYQPA